MIKIQELAKRKNLKINLSHAWAFTRVGRSHDEENKILVQDFKSLNLITSTLQETINLTAYTFQTSH